MVVGQVVIALDGELIFKGRGGVVEAVAGGIQSVAEVVIVGQRILRQDLGHSRVGTDAARVGLAEIVLANGSAGVLVLENSSPGERGGNGPVANRFLLGPRALKITEDKRFVVDDRAAERRAIDISNQFRNRAAALIIEEVVGVQSGVAQIVVRAPVVFVGSGARDQLNLSAGAASELGLAAFGNHSEFLHRIGVVGGQREAQARDQGIVHVDAVQRGVVAALAEPVDVGKAGVLPGPHVDLDARLEDRERDRAAIQLRQRVDIAHGDGV